jgi:hypothetical protein
MDQTEREAASVSSEVVLNSESLFPKFEIHFI